MNFASCRVCAPITLAILLLLLAQAAFARDSQPAALPNLLRNASFECGDGGYYESTNSRGKKILIPNDWIMTATGDIPIVSSARINFANGCDQEAHVERIDGRDSVLIEALDLEKPPEPGKPFDVSLIQQVSATSGTAYSLSGWTLSLCGGSSVPSDCPDDHYIAKLLGIDPTGGMDPSAPTVVWTENRRNFWTAESGRNGWTQLSASAIAQAMTVTVFARLDSPFQWHGNHGFIDALSLLQAPTATLSVVTATTSALTMTLQWNGSLGPDIPTIPNGAYQARFDVQYWHDQNNEWRDVVSGVDAGSAEFSARCSNSTYRFRARARAEQPEGAGAQPNQRYAGVWSEPIDVTVSVPPSGLPPATITNPVYLPLILNGGSC